jgi:gamma-glutamyltranspeptidase/glutathione hydrolase
MISRVLFILLIVLVSCSSEDQNTPAYHSNGRNGIVTASEKAPVAAGIKMLELGGTAADAGAAVILAEAVVDYPRFNIGGEVTMLYYEAATGKVKALSGVGEAPLSREAVDWYLANGIPSSNIRSALVPSVVDVCITAMKLYGNLSFAQVAGPTIELLESGKIVSSAIPYSLSAVSSDTSWYASLALTLRKLVEAEANCQGNRIEKLQAAADRFYRGDIADSLDAWYKRTGAFFTKEDLAKHVTEVEEPVSIQYKDYTVYKADTWTQGPVMLQTLRLLENFDLKKYGYMSAEYIHVVTEAFKLALADRDTYYGDPQFVKVPLKELLSDEYTKIRLPLIDMNKASNECRPGDPVNMKPLLGKGEYEEWMGGTTICSVIDKNGNMLAASPSGWGSDAGAGGSTGVTHGTRLKSLNVLPGHPNCIEPGKRPRVTLSPTIVLKNGKPFIVMSTEGGDTQDQNQVNYFLALAEFGITPYDAVTFPRFNTNQLQGSFNPTAKRLEALPRKTVLSIREGLSIETWLKLKDMGHNLEVNMDKVFIGHPALIYYDQSNKTAYGATDPSTARFTGAAK